MCVDNDEAAGSLAVECVDQVDDDTVQRRRGDAHRPRNVRVLMRTSEGRHGKLKNVVLATDRIGVACRNQRVGNKGKVGAPCCSNDPIGSSATEAFVLRSSVVVIGMSNPNSPWL